MSINYAFCSTCTQCVAVCPSQAFSWDHVPPVAYDKARLPSPEQLDELFKQRRSIRFFKRRRIDRRLLAEIVGYGIYAPTNNFDLRAIVSPPAAIVFIVGDRRVPLSVESAQYALSNMIFYAQAKGIGGCPWGPGQLFYDRSKPVRKCLGLQKRDHILGTLLLGYPAVRFSNKVEGKTLRIQWNGG